MFLREASSCVNASTCFGPRAFFAISICALSAGHRRPALRLARPLRAPFFPQQLAGAEAPALHPATVAESAIFVRPIVALSAMAPCVAPAGSHILRTNREFSAAPVSACTLHFPRPIGRCIVVVLVEAGGDERS